MEGRGRGLEAQTGDHQADAGQRQRVVDQSGLVGECLRDPREGRLAGRAVDEREPVEQRRRADRADDQVLQAGLQRRLPAHVGRAEDVERDRQQLEAQEQRDQVLRRAQHGHPHDRREQQRVVLALAGLLGRVVAQQQQHGGDAPDDEERLRNIARSSTASAPETIDLCSPHCQIVSPSAAPSVARVSAGTTPRRTTGALNRPTSSTITTPPASATMGERPAQSMCGPLTSAKGTITASLPAPAPAARAPAPAPGAWRRRGRGRRRVGDQLRRSDRRSDVALRARQRQLRVDGQGEDDEHQRRDGQPVVKREIARLHPLALTRLCIARMKTRRV